MRTWILERYQVYARVCLITALFLSPAIFHRDTVDVFNLVKISVLWVFGILALVFWLAWSVERRVWVPRVRLAYAAAGFLAAGVLATIFSANPALSLIGLYHRYGGLIPFALYAVIMLLIVALYWERPGDLKEIARAAAAASMVMAAYVLIQAAGQDWIEWREAGGGLPSYPVGTMGNSNFAGGYLGIAAPFVLYVALAARRQLWRRVLLVAFGLDLLALWFTQTRGGMAAGVAGLTAMGFLYRDRMPRWFKLGGVAGLGVLMVAAVIVLTQRGSGNLPGPFSHETFRSETFTIRTYYWTAAWRIFRANPILGTGLETYFANYPRYRLEEDGATYGLTITDKPHSIYFEYAANSGVVGLGSYLALVGLGLWYGYRRNRQLEGSARLLLVTFTGALAGYMGQGVFSIDVPPLAVMGWVALGGIGAIADPSVVAARKRLIASLREEPRRSNRGRSKNKAKLAGNPYRKDQRTRWPIHIGAAAAAAGLIAIGVRPYFADWVAKSGQVKATQNASPEVVRSYYLRATRLHPLEPAYRTLIGSIAEGQAASSQDPEEKRGFLQQALKRYQEALRLQPGNIFFILNIARIHTTWAEAIDPGRFAEADRWWSRAVSQDPTDWVVHDQYSLMLNSWANAAGGNPELRRRTAGELEKVVDLRPAYVPAWINLGKVYRALGETERARAAISRALKIEPTNEEAKGLLASL